MDFQSSVGKKRLFCKIGAWSACVACKCAFVWLAKIELKKGAVGKIKGGVYPLPA
jgi:hypothetical protein